MRTIRYNPDLKMNERKIIDKVFASMSLQEQEYANVCAFVFMRLFDSRTNAKINKRQVLNHVKDYLNKQY